MIITNRFGKYKYLLFLFIAVALECIVLCFTDNKMYTADGTGVTSRYLPNPIRIFVFFAIQFILARYKGLFDSKKKVIAIIITVLTLTVCLFLLSGDRYSLQSYYLVFIVLLGLAALGFILYYIKVFDGLDELYLVEALLFVTMCTFLYPYFAYGGDSSTHLARSLEVAQSYQSVQWNTYSDLLEGGVSIDSLKEYIEVANNDIIQEYDGLQLWPFRNTRYLAYINFASGIVLADALNTSPLVAFWLGELVNGYICVLIFYYGLRQLRGGKLLFTLFASLPYILVMTSKYSYTPQVIAWITFSSAYCIGLLQRNKKVTEKHIATVYGSLLYGLMAKAPYLFMCLFSWIIPREQYEPKTMRKNRIARYGTMIILLLTLVIPIFSNPAGFEMYSDTRGGESVSASGQLIYILKHPIWYVGVLIQNIIIKLSPAQMVFGQCGFLSLGSATGIGAMVVVPSLFAFLFFAVVLLDYNENHGLNLKTRGKILAVMGINLCVICTAMYMNFTPVGESVIQGLNPLYLLTFMFPAFYMCNFGVLSKKYLRILNTFVYGVWMMLLYYSVWVALLSRYN